MNIIPIKQEISDGFNNMEMTISWGGCADLDNNWKSKEISSAFSRIYFIKDGEGLLKCKGKEIVLRAGYMYLIPIGLKFAYSCNDKMTQIFFHINMHKGVGGDFLRSCGEIKEIYVGDKMIDMVEKSVSADTYFDIMRIKKILYESIDMCLENEEGDSLMPHNSPFVSEVIKYININLSIKLKAEDIAAHFSVSRSTLCRRFKKETGVTLHDYIEDLVFYWVEKMVVEERYSISQISDMTGFCDQFYFSKRFMMRFGKSPANYRKEHS